MRGVLEVRRVPTAALVATVSISLCGSVLFWKVAAVSDALDAIGRWSGGLVQPTLTINLAQLAVLAILWFGVYRLRPSDVGFESRHLARGLGVLCGGWLGIQAIRLLGAVVMGYGVTPSAMIASGKSQWLIGLVVGQVFGNALGEELMHRGLILRQLFLRMHLTSQRSRLVAALVSGGIVFAVGHIFMLLDGGYPAYQVAGALVFLTAMGCFFAGIYLRTGNLFVAIAVHALFNVPGDVVASPIDGQVLAVALGISLIAIGPSRPRRATSAA